MAVGRLPVELTGLPIYDHTGKLAGYRGFGVCRDLEALTRLEALRRHEFFNPPPAPQPLSADVAASEPAQDPPAAIRPRYPLSHRPAAPELPASIDVETSHQTDLETPVETSNEMLKNVLPFRPLSEPKSPALTPVENSAFNELARQLAARLEGDNGATVSPATPDIDESVVAPAIATETHGAAGRRCTSGWRSRSRPRAARADATGCCSTSCPSAS